MSRYGQGGDTPWIPDGDVGFIGIDMLHDPASLPPGYLSKGENTRLRDRAAAQRSGLAFPADFNPAFEGKIIGSHIFSNPNGEEVMLVATSTAGYVWALQQGKDPVQIAIDASDPSGTVGSTLVHFVQAFNQVLLLRVPSGGLPPLVWDGVNANKFLPVTTPPPAPLTIIPSTWAGVPFQNRLLLYNPYWGPLPWRHQFIATEVLLYDRYDASNFTFTVNAGESDIISSVFPFFKQGVVVFMINSIHMVQDFTVDPALTTQRLLNGRIGSVGVYGPLMVGNDIIFLSRNGTGFYKLSELIEDQIAADPVPISRKIQPVIDRIDWNRAFLYHSSAAIGDRAYFTLPLDHNSGAADGMVVLNTSTMEWESAPDTWASADFRINRLHATLFDGVRSLFALDYAAHRIYLMETGLEDELGGDSLPVKLKIESRGYTFGDPGAFKRVLRAQVGVRSYNPRAVVTALSDGVNEAKQVAVITKNRSKYYLHGKADFDPLTDDPTAPRRQDYSDVSENSAIEDFEDLPEGPLNFIPPTPFIFTGVLQESLERMLVRQNGRHCRIRIENNQGKLDVLGIGVDAIPTQEGIRVLA